MWETLIESSFMLKRRYTSLYTLKELGDGIRRHLIGSKLGLNTFARFKTPSLANYQAAL